MANSGLGGAWFVTTAEYWKAVLRSGPILGWQIFYADGSVVNSDTPWNEAPRTGVQCIMVHHPGGLRNIVRGRDEYTMPGKKQSKLGSEIDHERYMEICRHAISSTWRA